MKFFIIYLVIINLFGLFQMFSDKQKAINGEYRIPEKRLFLVAILGGSIGSILGMQLFRHKTQHATFVIGMPLILILQVALLIFLKTRGVF